MIISLDYKFIFIKTRKTAGSSIEKILLDKLKGTDYIFGGMEPEQMPPKNISEFCEHRGHEWIRSNFGDRFKHFFKFAVERNPWDKTLSQWYWVKSLYPKKFKDFNQDLKNNNKALIVNDWKLYTRKDRIDIDQVIKYENLHQDFKKICETINVEYNNELETTRLKSTQRKIKSYKNVYTAESLDIINIRYDKVIQEFEYKF